MRKPPAVATALLSRIVAEDEALVGDLVEEYSSGRSRGWYWRQVLSALALGTRREIRTHPRRALASVATGWATLLLLFFLLGDRTADALAGRLWGWDRASAYVSGPWWPYQISAVLVSYAGFALSALVVARLQRRFPGMVLAYAASVLVAMIASAVMLGALSSRPGGVRVPHTLFYAASVTLPYQWYSGVLLAPSLVAAVGLLAGRRPQRASLGGRSYCTIVQ